MPDPHHAERPIEAIGQSVSYGSGDQIIVLNKEYVLQCSIPARVDSMAFNLNRFSCKRLYGNVRLPKRTTTVKSLEFSASVPHGEAPESMLGKSPY